MRNKFEEEERVLTTAYEKFVYLQKREEEAEMARKEDEQRKEIKKAIEHAMSAKYSLLHIGWEKEKIHVDEQQMKT